MYVRMNHDRTTTQKIITEEDNK